VEIDFAKGHEECEEDAHRQQEVEDRLHGVACLVECRGECEDEIQPRTNRHCNRQCPVSYEFNYAHLLSEYAAKIQKTFINDVLL
jgi:hypothetical protein